MTVLELIERPGPEIEAAIEDVVVAYNDSVGPPHRWKPFAIVIRDETGAVAGGLWGACVYDWCVVKLLALPAPLRGAGHGTRVMAEAEAYAVAAGCLGIWLDTFSFQARGFYERLGFSCFAALADHPVGGGRYFMVKRF